MPDLAPAGSSEGLPRKEFAYLRMHTKERQKEINRPVRAHRRATGMRRRPQRVEAAYRARLVRRGPETLRDMVVLLPLACAIPGFNSVCHQVSDVASEFLSMRATRARVCERWCAVSYHLFLPLLCSGLDFHVQAVTSGTTPTARRRLRGSFLQPGRHWKGLPFADCHGQTRTEQYHMHI